MKNQNSEEVIYSICVGDLQEVSQEFIERRLTKREIAKVRDSIGSYIDWVQAIEHAIREHVRE